jgi:hypothetical protein
MVSRARPTRTVRTLLASRRLSGTFWLCGGSARDAVGIVATVQPGGAAIVAASPAVDRTGAIVREKPVGFGADVLQQSAADLADEFVGRQCGAVAHDGLAGHAGGSGAAGWITTAPVGVGTGG